jgi:hypothetical protein
MEGISSLTKLQILSLNNNQINDLSIPHLSKLKNLKYLFITETDLSGEGIAELKSALSTRWIEGDMMRLSQKSPSDQWVQTAAYVKQLGRQGRLKFLDLSNTNVADEHLAPLHDLVGVELIDVRGTRVSQRGIEQLQQTIPSCKIRDDFTTP